MTIPVPSKVSSSPVLNDTIFLDNEGNPLFYGFIYTYEAGSFTNQQTTFTTSAGDVENTNPIQLDSSGRMQTQMWLADGYEYNFTLGYSYGQVIKTFENIRGSVGTQAGSGIGSVIWNVSVDAPVYVSSNQFYLPGDVTVEYQFGNRVRWEFNDNTYAFGVISTVTYDGDTDRTYVTSILDSIDITDAIIGVAYSALVVQNYTADAGAIGYTESFTYSGANVGTKLQAVNSLVTNHGKSYDALYAGSDTYTVTTGFAPTTYDGMTIDVRFIQGFEGSTAYVNVNNLGQIQLQQFDYQGNLVDATITTGLCTRLMYNGSIMVLLDQLPYTPPTPPAPTFAPTMGSVNMGGTFTVKAGPSGKVAITVANTVHALYGNFGVGTFNLYANGTIIDSRTTWFFEWDSRQGGGNPTLLGTVTTDPDTDITFQVTYAGPGTAVNPSTWMAITS